MLIPRSIPLPHKSIPAARTALLRGLLAPLAGGTALRGHDDEEGDSTFKHNALAEMETQPTRPHTLIRNPIDFNGHRLKKHICATPSAPPNAQPWPRVGQPNQTMEHSNRAIVQLIIYITIGTPDIGSETVQKHSRCIATLNPFLLNPTPKQKLLHRKMMIRMGEKLKRHTKNDSTPLDTHRNTRGLGMGRGTPNSHHGPIDIQHNRKCEMSNQLTVDMMT